MAKYPRVKVRLSEMDGNIFFIGGKVGAALAKAGVARPEISQFYEELQATPSYDAALRKVMEWVVVS